MIKFKSLGKLSAFKKPLTTVALFIESELSLSDVEIVISMKSLNDRIGGELESPLNGEGAHKIKLNKSMTPTSWIKFIAHEMTHIKQQTEGRLIPLDDCHVKWLNEAQELVDYQLLNTKPDFDPTKDFEAYKSQPWELEVNLL